MNHCFSIAVLVVLVAAALAQNTVRRKPPKKENVPEVDRRCMDCLCQASSNCDETLKCHNSGGDAYFCGPYVISWAYWHDGGRPGDYGRPHDFENCLNNKTCAEQAVRGYMRKYGRDCDASGAVDCHDFARIHKLGFGSCGADHILDSDYWQKYEVCYSGGNEYRPPYNYNPDPSGVGVVAEPVEYDYGDGTIQARNGQHN